MLKQLAMALISLALLAGPLFAQDMGGNDPLSGGEEDGLKKAEKLIQASQKLSQQLKQAGRRAQALQQRYIQARQSGNKQAAQQYGQQLQQFAQAYRKYQQRLGQMVHGALHILKKETSKSSPPAKAYELKGQVETMMGKTKEAIQSFSKAIDIDSINSNTYFRRGVSYYQLMDWDKAYNDLAKALQMGFESKQILPLQAQIRFNQHRFSESAAIWKRLLGDPQMPSQAKERINKQMKAAEDYEKFIKKEKEIRSAERQNDNNPQVKLVTSKGEITVELFENQAPNTVANFIKLVEDNFYDGTKFHRVIPNFMAQGGDPNSKDKDPRNDGKGDPGYFIDDEVSGDYRRHFAGSLSMANSGPNTNGSQFFLCFAPAFWLNGKHTVFGRVIQGMDVVKKVRRGDVLKSATVIRKRSHPYAPQKNQKK